MRHLPNKAELRSELVRRLRADLEGLERAQRGAVEAATHEEAKPENDKDTRALEASYLARGQALRIEQLRAGVAEVEAFSLREFGATTPIALGAVVTVEDDDGAATLFLAPHGGGLKLAAGQAGVVTPRSPLGAALLGKREGDDIEVVVEGKKRERSITNVR